MKKVKIINITKNNLLVEKALLADKFYHRFKGLMGKRELKEVEGLCIKPCISIHTFFMKFSIDVMFVDKNDYVCMIIKNFKPWRVSPFVKNSRYVVELPSGTIEKTGTEIGDKIKTI